MSAADASMYWPDGSDDATLRWLGMELRGSPDAVRAVMVALNDGHRAEIAAADLRCFRQAVRKALRDADGKVP